MKKDEILKRAKKENLINDEAKNNKARTGKDWGARASLLVLILFWIANYINNKNRTHLFAILLVYITFEEFGKYYANKEKGDLITASFSLIMFIIAFSLGVLDIWNF